jgi:hypothetical protein
MSRRLVLRTLMGTLVLAVTLVSLFIFPGSPFKAHAYVACPDDLGQQQADITVLGKTFQATEEEPVIYNNGSTDITRSITTQTSHTFNVTVSAEAQAEAGVILEKAQVKLGVSVGYTFQSQKGVTTTFTAPAHTEYHVEYGTYIDHLYVDTYYIDMRCNKTGENIDFVDVAESSGAWNVWQKPITN